MTPAYLLFFQRLIRVGVVVIMLSLLLGLLPAKAEHRLIQDVSDQCTGLDVIFLIDESGSMQFNDPHQVRGNTVRTVLDILGDNAVYFCPGTQHRIAVLGFGDQSGGGTDTVAYISPTAIAPTLEHLPDWQVQKQQ